MMSFYSPLRYPGGKTCNYNFVTSLLQENSLNNITYAEPYAGGAGLALKLLCTGKVKKILLNDCDKSIYCFWTFVFNHTQRFCSWLKKTDININNWKKYRAIQDNKLNEPDFLVAQSTFFLNRCNISGVLKGGVIGGMDQSGQYKMDARFKKAELITKIMKIAEFKNNIILSNLDGIKFIENINKSTDDMFIYLDPPYYKKGANLYLNFYTDDNHKKLAKNVSKIRKHWIMSYDNEEYIKELYRNNRKIVYNLKQSASNRIGNEILIFDKKLKFEKSMKLLANPMKI